MRLQFAALLLIFLSSSRVGADTTPVALVLSVTGVVKLCDKGECKDEDFTILNNKKDLYRLLHNGDELRCAPLAKVKLFPDPTLKDHGNGEIFDACLNAGSGKTVLHTELQAKAPRQSLQDYQKYQLAGRSKGAESMVFSPPDSGSVDPGTLVVHWRTRPPLKMITISIKSADGSVIFSQAGLDGATGTFDSADLRHVLSAIRDDPARSRNLVITLQAPMRADDSTHFSLLSSADVEAVEKELAESPSSPPGVRAIARASVYESAHMYDLVAAEYDDALEQAPESLDLLRVAYSANTRIGNLARARELLDRLEAAESAR